MDITETLSLLIETLSRGNINGHLHNVSAEIVVSPVLGLVQRGTEAYRALGPRANLVALPPDRGAILEFDLLAVRNGIHWVACRWDFCFDALAMSPPNGRWLVGLKDSVMTCIRPHSVQWPSCFMCGGESDEEIFCRDHQDDYLRRVGTVRLLSDALSFEWGDSLHDWIGEPIGEPLGSKLLFQFRFGGWLLFQAAYKRRPPDWLAAHVDTGVVRRYSGASAADVCNDLRTHGGHVTEPGYTPQGWGQSSRYFYRQR